LADSCSHTTVAPTKPMIDLEPCYEDHLPLDLRGPDRIDALAVRRACYWSLLAAPVAGVSYGAHGVWSWQDSAGVPLNHPASGIARTWKEAIGFPGSESVSHLRAIFKSIEWWRLNPCQELLEAQPGIDSPLEFIAAACTPERDIAVIYVPDGGTISLRPGFFGEHAEARCIDPASGRELWARQLGVQLECETAADRLVIIRTLKEEKKI